MKINDFEVDEQITELTFELADLLNMDEEEIKTDLESKGYFLPNNLIPVCEGVTKLKINITYLKVKRANRSSRF